MTVTTAARHHTKIQRRLQIQITDIVMVLFKGDDRYIVMGILITIYLVIFREFCCYGGRRGWPFAPVGGAADIKSNDGIIEISGSNNLTNIKQPS